MTVYRLLQNRVEQLPELFDLYRDDPTLNGRGASAFAATYELDVESFKKLFLSIYSLDYIAHFFHEKQYECRVMSFPQKTNTCTEKLSLLPGWYSNSIIKALYFESSSDGSLCAAITPEFGRHVNIKNLQKELNFSKGDSLIRSTCLPQNMIYGTCSPFITEADLITHGGAVRHIVFDDESLSRKQSEGGLDDFSFGLDHKLSIQMNYYDCYCMLKERYQDVVKSRNVSTTSFKQHEEKMDALVLPTH